MTTGADLVMLAVDENRGALRPTPPLGFALAAAELVDLARARRIEAAPDARVRVTESLRTGDPALDATLAALASPEGGQSVQDVVAARQAGAVARQVRALLSSGALTGREISVYLGGPPMYGALRAADPGRRRELVGRLVGADAWKAGSALEAFGALAHICGLGSSIPGWEHRQARRRLEELAEEFGDTWRYLPGCRPEFVLDEEDLPRGRVHPAQEQPWRLAVRLAVQEAGRRVAALSGPSRGGSGLDRDPDIAARLDRLWRQGF